MSRSRKRNLMEINLSRIFLTKLKLDSRGEYIPYCDYYEHRGVIGNSKSRECEQRACEHYRVFREER
jgi:hypothetical protein